MSLFGHEKETSLDMPFILPTGEEQYFPLILTLIKYKDFAQIMISNYL